MRYRVGGYVPFSYKMMVPYLLLVMLTDIIVGYFSYRSAEQSRTELIQANMTWALQQMRDNTGYQMADLQAVSDSLFSNPSYQTYLQVSGDRSTVYETTVHSLLPLMETPLKMTAQNLRMIVYVTNDKIDDIYGNLNSEIKDKSYAILSMDRLYDQTWYADMNRSGEDNVWRQVDNDEEHGNLSLMRKLISFTDYQTEIGFLRISVPMKDLFHSLLVSGISEGSVIQVIDEREGRILFSNVLEKGQPAKDRHFLRISEKVPNTDIVLQANVPMSVLHQDAGRIRKITLLVCGISFVIMAAIAFLIARYSGRSLQQILSAIRLFQKGRFSERLPFKGNDEFDQISAAFNSMAQNIDELIREVYLQGIQKKEAELKALQAQINPHFLYNTLSSINSLANIGETRKLSAMVTGLAKFYRLTLNEGDMLISMEKEIDQVRSYLDIQAIKYANRFTVSYELDPEILPCHTVKLIVQPFVENVLKHAWFEERIHIRITGSREDENIEINIIDNGVGMTRDVLHRLFDRTVSYGEGGYGIHNVNERIQLQYGADYGVKIFSRLGIGTTVRILLPYEAGI